MWYPAKGEAGAAAYICLRLDTVQSENCTGAAGTSQILAALSLCSQRSTSSMERLAVLWRSVPAVLRLREGTAGGAVL